MDAILTCIKCKTKCATEDMGYAVGIKACIPYPEYAERQRVDTDCILLEGCFGSTFEDHCYRFGFDHPLSPEELPSWLTMQDFICDPCVVQLIRDKIIRFTPTRYPDLDFIGEYPCCCDVCGSFYEKTGCETFINREMNLVNVNEPLHNDSSRWPEFITYRFASRDQPLWWKYGARVCEECFRKIKSPMLEPIDSQLHNK